VKPWQRIVGVRPHAGGGSAGAGSPDSGGDSRSGFDDLRHALEASLEREPGSPLLVRASLGALLGALVARASQRRGAVGLVAFELENGKALREQIAESDFENAFGALALELRRRLRASDDLGRLGEVQIVAVLPGCEPQALGGVSKRLRLCLEARELALGDRRLRPSIKAAWLCASPRPGSESPAQLLDELEHALDRARPGDPG